MFRVTPEFEERLRRVPVRMQAVFTWVEVAGCAYRVDREAVENVRGEQRLRLCADCWGTVWRTRRLPIYCATSGFDVGSHLRLYELLEFRLVARARIHVVMIKLTTGGRQLAGGDENAPSFEHRLLSHAICYPQEGPHAMLRVLPNAGALLDTMAVFYVGPAGRR